jgi:hypothetical protein
MNSLDTNPVVIQNESKMMEISVLLLLLFVSSMIVYYINELKQNIVKQEKYIENINTNINEKIDTVLELCERLNIQNIGAYDITTNLANNVTSNLENITKYNSEISVILNKMLSIEIHRVEKTLQLDYLSV